MSISRLATLAAVSLFTLLTTTSYGNTQGAGELLPEFRPIGGVNNNLDHPSFNAVPNSPEINLAPLNFTPGKKNGLADGPNPRVISNLISGGTGSGGAGPDAEDKVASAWLYVFGQFLDHDLGLEFNTPATQDISIPVPAGDPLFPKGTSIVMNRDIRDPKTNTIINTVAGYLDLSQLYGSTDDIAAKMRGPNGTLATSSNGDYLTSDGMSYFAGDVRVMENPELTAVTTLFMREHNYWAKQLRVSHRNWSGDQIYSMAKAITTAEYQQVVYKEFVPLVLGRELGDYKGYDSSVRAQISQEFSAAVFRFGHSQISDEQTGLDNSGKETFTQTLDQAFFNTPADDEAHGFDPLFRGISADFSQATDVYVVPTLRNLLFAGLVGGDVDEIDLIAIDIQRERDVGVGTLNQTRHALGLRPYSSFAEVTSDRVLQKNLASVYGSVDNLDLFIGGLAEDHVPGALVGQTYWIILYTQFDSLRAGDRFYWENQKFDRAMASSIGRTRLADIILRNSDTRILQANVFRVPTAQQPIAHNHTRRPVDLRGRGFADKRLRQISRGH